MDRYGSFVVDHNKLVPGVYISRCDDVDSHIIYTIDIRCIKPYEENPLSPMTLHSIEHIVATEMEKYSNESIKKIYFGPMGCASGFYALVSLPKGEDPVQIIKYLVKCTQKWDKKVPFADRMSCGNCYTLASLPYEKEEVSLEIDFIHAMLQKCIAKGAFDEYPYIK